MPTEQEFTEKVIDEFIKYEEDDSQKIITFLQENMDVIHAMYGDYVGIVKRGWGAPQIMMTGAVAAVVNCLDLLY